MLSILFKSGMFILLIEPPPFLQTVHDRSHVLFGHGSKKEGVDKTIPFCRFDLFRQLIVRLIVHQNDDFAVRVKFLDLIPDSEPFFQHPGGVTGRLQ